MRSFALRCLFFAFLFTASIFAQSASAPRFPGEITVAVDASEAPGRLFHSRLTIPVQPGPLTSVLSGMDSR